MTMFINKLIALLPNPREEIYQPRWMAYRGINPLGQAGGSFGGDIEDRARPIQSDTARRVTPGLCWTGRGVIRPCKGPDRGERADPFKNTEDPKMGA
jgi:hypothetical protein